MNNNQVLNHILIIKNYTQRRIIALQEDLYSLGRAPENQIIFSENRNVSRYHATLVKKTNSTNNQDSYCIIDGDLNGKGSTNGLLINGKYSSQHELKHGDIIKFGDSAIAY